MLTTVRLIVGLCLVIAGSQDALSQNCYTGSSAPVVRKGMRPNTQKTYRFGGGFTEAQMTGVRYAFMGWGNANWFTKLNITFVETTGAADFNVMKAPPSAFPNPNDGAGFSAALDGEGYITGGLIAFTTNTNLVDSQDGYRRLGGHEIGHAHGLGDTHRTDGKSVMNNAIGKNDSGGGIRYSPSLCDAIKAAYASKWWSMFPGVNVEPCPYGGCFGYDPFPPPCWGYSPWDGWCHPTNPAQQNFPDGATPSPTYSPPGIVITSPGHGATVSGSLVNVTVASGDADGRVMAVMYYVNGAFAYGTIQHPFSWSVANVPAGVYTVQAVAYDNEDIQGASAPVTITVTPGSGGGGGGAGAGILSPGQRLYGGQRLYSSNGAYYLEHQTDGNLVVYGPGGVTWASMAFGNGGYTEMQGDGNLVSYNGAGTPYWATMTFWPGSNLNMQNDGNLVMYHNGSVVCGVNSLQPGEICP